MFSFQFCVGRLNLGLKKAVAAGKLVQLGDKFKFPYVPQSNVLRRMQQAGTVRSYAATSTSLRPFLPQFLNLRNWVLNPMPPYSTKRPGIYSVEWRPCF